MKKIILILIIFIDNLISMELTKLEDKQEGLILNLPNEMLNYIISQIISTDAIKAVNDWNDIFENSPEIDVSSIKSLAKTCKKFYVLCKYIFELRDKKFNILLESLSIRALKDYENISKEELNNRLINILNKNQKCKEDLEEAVKLIIAGADINAQSNYGDTVLILASIYGYKGIVEILINKAVDVNIADNSGNTSLIYAVILEHKDIVKILLNSKNIDVNVFSSEGNTCLIYATMLENHEVLKMLLNSKDIDINAQSNQGYTALTIAYKYCYDDVIKVLLNAEANFNINKRRRLV